MNNDNKDKQDDKSLLNDLKKAISKNIKGIPLTKKLLIIGIVIGLFVFLLLFCVLSIIPFIFFFFNDDTSSNGNGSGFAYIVANSEDNYWWPIGGSEVTTYNGNDYAIGQPTTTFITSYYGYRDMNGDGTAEDKHNGIDISNVGKHYIIAVANGTIFSVNDSCDDNGFYGNTCGGELGNYVIIEHSGGVYSIYAHMESGSVSVKKGDVVSQGQIIGIMGNSGSSTGKHLHFQIEEGSRSSQNAVNPLDYVSSENPRPITIESGIGSNKLLSMLQSWEGTGTISGDNYVVYDDGAGNLTVGCGVTLKNHSDRFSQRGIDVSSLGAGSELPISVVDDIELEIVNEYRNSVINYLNSNSISLTDYQIDALTIRRYNTGNIQDFSKYYKEYGVTDSLYDEYMSKPTSAGGNYMSGLARRREAEWILFKTGAYTFNA